MFLIGSILMWIRPITVLLGVAALWGCGQREASGPDITRFAEYVNNEAGPGAFARARTVIRLTERGCMGCNRSFADLVQHHLDDSSMVLVLDASGQSIDISPFQTGRGQVIEDHDGRMRSMGFPEGSYAIFLNTGRIDTIVRLEAQGIEERLRFISVTMDQPDAAESKGQ
jgi:hypothetical protein